MSARERLPDRRQCERFEFRHRNVAYTCTYAKYSDGRLAELFLSNGKSGSDSDHAAKDSAIVASIALQHGVAVETIRHGLLRDDMGRAATPLGAALDLLAGEGAS